MNKLAVCVLASVAIAYGNTYTFQTAAGATNPTDNNPLDAEAIVTTSANMISVELFNLLNNPTAISQVLSNFTFTMGASATYTGVSVDTANTGTLIDKTWSATPVTDTTDTISHWNVSNGASSTTSIGSGTSVTTLTLSSILSGTSDLIIGNPASGGTFSNANNSISNCHACPYILGYATFNISLTGVSAATTITNPIFGFGTAVGTESSSGVSAVPEPSPAVLIGCGLLCFSAAGCRRRKARYTPEDARVS